MIRFDAKTQLIISDDLTNDIWSLLKEEQSLRVLLVIDSNIVEKQNIIREMIDFLARKLNLLVYKIKSQEPTTDIVNQCTVNLKKQKFDMLIGIGGGSTMDLAKALSVTMVNKGRVENYHGTGKAFVSGIKKIMVPTTAGTGSEVTPSSVLVNPVTKFKRAITGKYVTADYAVLNARLTLTMPDSITASTGMDALAHAIESYTAKNANDITNMYSKRAFSLVYNNLPKVFQDKQNIALRKSILLGSYLAGYAIYNSNTGACHSMAYSLGIYNNIPHSVAVAYILPKVVKLNVEKGCCLYADLYDLIVGKEEIASPQEKAKRFVSLLENYIPLSYLDKNFMDYGVNQNNYKFLAERGLDLTSALSNNPVEFGLEDAKKVLIESL